MIIKVHTTLPDVFSQITAQDIIDYATNDTLREVAASQLTGDINQLCMVLQHMAEQMTPQERERLKKCL